MKKIQRFFLNAMIMTATSLLMNAVGVWFNLYISGKIGAEGMGVFQLIMSVYSFTVTFAASGINLASTRLVAEEAASPNGNVKGAMRRCFGYALLFGGAASLFLFFAAPFHRGDLPRQRPDRPPPQDHGAFDALHRDVLRAERVLYRRRRVAKSAASQIFEQFLKISLSIVGLTFLMPPGLEYACLAITGSGVIAEGLSFVSSLALYLGDSRGFRRKGAPKNRLTGRLFGIALPMAMSSYLRSGLATVKNLLVPVRLQAAARDGRLLRGLRRGARHRPAGHPLPRRLPQLVFQPHRPRDRPAPQPRAEHLPPHPADVRPQPVLLDRGVRRTLRLLP